MFQTTNQITFLGYSSVKDGQIRRCSLTHVSKDSCDDGRRNCKGYAPIESITVCWPRIDIVKHLAIKLFGGFLKFG